MVIRLIAHRGNIEGDNPDSENHPEQIEQVVNKFDCEVDLRFKEKSSELFLGHDGLDYKVELEWLVNFKERLWIHCKDYASLNFLSLNNFDLNYFWHQDDDFTLTSKGYIWTYPMKRVGSKSVIVIKDTKELNLDCFGVCTNEILKVKDMI